MIKLSTIIPFHNVREYIEESINSIIIQGIKGHEIILVDDDSDDGSEEYAKALARKHDWIHYIKTNGVAPGGARNAGIAIAKGEFLNFADADDIVPEGAYQKMLDTAEETGAEIVIGKAVRLDDNIGKIKASRLHDRVYSQFFYQTNIRENPYLIFDTTVWNKLIRRSFWEKCDIQFPERTPYQDIPVTFKLHYFAEKVIMLDEVVYIWRVRKGDNRSITQHRSELDNFLARLKMMNLVDEYIEKNVKEVAIKQMRSIKWLDTDLKAFMNECTVLNDDKLQLLMAEIRSYIIETNLVDSLDKLPLLTAMEYKALLENDIEKLRVLRRFETESLKNIKSKMFFFKPVGQFPKDIFGKKYLSLNTTLDFEHLTQRIIGIDNYENGICIKGYAFLLHRPVRWTQEVQLKAYLMKSSGDNVCSITVNKYRSMHSEKVGVSSSGERLCNYVGAGYKIFLDKELLKELDSGMYHIRLCWSTKGQRRETTLRGIGPALCEKLKTHIWRYDNKSIKISSTLKNEPEIQIGEARESEWKH